MSIYSRSTYILCTIIDITFFPWFILIIEYINKVWLEKSITLSIKVEKVKSYTKGKMLSFINIKIYQKIEIFIEKEKVSVEKAQKSKYQIDIAKSLRICMRYYLLNFRLINWINRSFNLSNKLPMFGRRITFYCPCFKHWTLVRFIMRHDYGRVWFRN